MHACLMNENNYVQKRSSDYVTHEKRTCDEPDMSQIHDTEKKTLKQN